MISRKKALQDNHRRLCSATSRADFSAAQGLSKDWYRKQEHRRARQWIMDNVQCDDVRASNSPLASLEATKSALRMGPTCS